MSAKEPPPPCRHGSKSVFEGYFAEEEAAHPELYEAPCACGTFATCSLCGQPHVLVKRCRRCAKAQIAPEGKETMARKKDEETSTTEASEDEGDRSFAVFLQQIEDGAFHAEISSELRALSVKLDEHVTTYGVDAKGSLTITISLAAMRNGTIAAIGDVKKKEPKAKRAGGVFWLTKGKNLTLENPRQQKLPLREVPANNDRVRDLPVDARTTRQI
ncbi:MAG: hypothetical protein FWD69_17945 [Polyangiaceae bacterium]|nr:hypothetical protein [Polyangiaceae bacterium]